MHPFSFLVYSSGIVLSFLAVNALVVSSVVSVRASRCRVCLCPVYQWATLPAVGRGRSGSIGQRGSHRAARLRPRHYSLYTSRWVGTRHSVPHTSSRN